MINNHIVKKILRCSCCGQTIWGKYYIDCYGQASCADHDITQCFCCHRFCAPKESIKVNGYGYFCKECQNRIVDGDSAVRIAGLVNKFYLSNGLNIPQYSLQIVKSEKMLAEANNISPLGLAYSSQPYKILLLRLMSRTGFAGVLAHEVLHLWQYRNNINLPLPLCEGLCEMGSYLFLKSIGKPEADIHLKYLAENEDKIYGNGYRIFQKVYDRFGWNGVIKAAFLKSK